MSSPSATAQEGIPRSAGAPIRHPLALTALGLAFLAATLGAFGLGSKLTSSSAADSKGSRLAAGSLALLHARLEQQALMASLLSSGNAELSTLTAEVTALETKLKDTVSQVENKKASVATLTEQTTNSESRHQALTAEEPRLEKIRKAFAAALAKKNEADAAILKAWQAEWKSVSKDALENIGKARASLHALQTKAAPWSNAKDTMTPEQRSDLISQRAKTEDTLETARKTADDAQKKLSILIESQRQQLEKAAAAAPPL